MFERKIPSTITSQPTSQLSPPEPIISPNLSEAVDKLKRFKDKPEIATVINALSLFELLGDVETAEIEKPRNILLKIINNPANKEIIKDNLSLYEAAYFALIALAEFKPISDEDLSTLDTIAPDLRIGSSAGRFFNIAELVQAHEAQEYKHELGESKWIGKGLNNPYTGTSFHPRDIEQFQAFAALRSTLERPLEFKNLRKERESKDLPEAKQVNASLADEAISWLNRATSWLDVPCRMSVMAYVGYHLITHVNSDSELIGENMVQLGMLFYLARMAKPFFAPTPASGNITDLSDHENDADAPSP